MGTLLSKPSSCRPAPAWSLVMSGGEKRRSGVEMDRTPIPLPGGLASGLWLLYSRHCGCCCYITALGPDGSSLHVYFTYFQLVSKLLLLVLKNNIFSF